MLHQLIEFSLRQRLLIMLATGALILAGLWSAFRMPIDAVPDITNIQVRIDTEVPALAPEEIERLVTFPIESALAGLPGLTEMRSLSKFGLSQVVLTFQDGTDIYRVRQLTAERLGTVRDELPEGLTPHLAPISTGLGDIYFYVVGYATGFTNQPASPYDQLMELSMVQEIIIKPMLRNTPGLAEVNTSGGYIKQIVIKPDPELLFEFGIGMEEIAEVVRMNTENAGGGMVEIGREQVIIRADSRMKTMDDISALPIRLAAGAHPVLIRDVAEVGIEHSFRTGASTENGQEAVLGGAIMLAGENSRFVARAVCERLNVIQAKLPEGIEIRNVYDRSELVDDTIQTVKNNLFHGAVMVAVVLLLLLGNIRAALIVSLAIPLSFLFAMTGMVACRMSGNLMSLGAIDFGLIIDGAVVMVENIVRRLGERQHALGRTLSCRERIETVLSSSQEVASPMFYGVLIITVVYVPILSLAGIEGKMFKPMALTVMFCLVGALVLALTLMPVLCSFFLRGKIAEKDNALVVLVKAVYTPLLACALRMRWLFVMAALAMFAWSGLVFSRLGAEFIPQLDEGSISLQLIRSSSLGLEASLGLQKRSERVLLEKFPEISRLFSRIGTAEVASDPMGPNVADTYIMLTPRQTWRKTNGRQTTKDELMTRMREELDTLVPGQAMLFTQPIQLRFNEIMAGARADLVLKLYGDDFVVLEQLAFEARDLLANLSGGSDVEFEPMGRQPMIQVSPKRDVISQLGLHGADINRLVELSLGGEKVGVMIEGNRRSDIVVRLDESVRRRFKEYDRLPLRLPDGGLIRLGEVADIRVVEEVGTIQRESNQRRVNILINVRGRDTEGFVREADQLLKQEMMLPDGYYYEFGGQFENLIKARKRLGIVVPAALTLIFILLFMSFQSLRQALLVFVSIPLAVTGGVFSLSLRGMPFTISAGIGFIALSGIAVLNGIMLISFINQLRGQGVGVRKAVVDGTLTRLRPKLMTALTTAIGFVPMAMATGPGAEVQRPLATVVIGGVLTSTFLTLIILPILYDWMEQRAEKRKALI